MKREAQKSFFRQIERDNGDITYPKLSDFLPNEKARVRVFGSLSSSSCNHARGLSVRIYLREEKQASSIFFWFFFSFDIIIKRVYSMRGKSM